MKLLLSPHNDDASLFAAFTCIREKPLVSVITDSWKQFNRGENITAEERWKEDIEAMKILGCPIVRCGVRDDIANAEMIQVALEKFKGFERIYAPAAQGGNPHHDMIGKVARQVFSCPVVWYATYSNKELYTTGNTELMPTAEELEIKNKALECYESQRNLAATAPHFTAVLGRSEWYL